MSLRIWRLADHGRGVLGAYAPDETRALDELIGDPYLGIGPAPAIDAARSHREGDAVPPARRRAQRRRQPD
ncbi:hypothetical protein BQ8794_10301 [Mesorhizobium prunaredense]|uniref:Uncharacterized protein n=1 Tax=Mesorhizobium prunaredense TaxID=1631249 RepID=A0A1R3UZ68_9HYPH|nr:hypothetical protein BQ8794_10301 [Mesorhizobium prunaredense]